MDFLSQYYYYLSFFCGCAYLLFALSCFLTWKFKFGKISYFWLMPVGVLFAAMKFMQMFVSDGTFSSGSSLAWINAALYYFAVFFFFLAAAGSYRKTAGTGKTVKYALVFCSAVPLAGIFYGSAFFSLMVFLFMWLPSSLIMLFAIYKSFRNSSYYGRGILLMCIIFALYCEVYFAAEFADILKLGSVQCKAVCDVLLAVIVFWLAASIFRFFKVSHEKHVKIYDYMPFYWRHIPIGTILFAVLVGGLFFSMYLENYSRSGIERNSHSVVAGVTENIKAKLETSDELSGVLSGIRILAGAMEKSESADNAAINKLLDDFVSGFGVSAIFAVDNSGNVIFHSNLSAYPEILNSNLRHTAYFTEAQRKKYGETFARSVSDSGQSYYSSSRIEGRDGSPLGVLVVKDNIEDVEARLRQYRNIYVIDANGTVFLSSNNDANSANIWVLYGADNAGQKGLNEQTPAARELFDKDTVVVNGELFYVSRRYINEEGWSVIYFASLSSVRQFKFLSIAGVWGAMVIVLLLYWSLNQSNRIFALARQHKAILGSARSIVIISTDTEGEIIVYGQGAEEITGYSKSEMSAEGFGHVFADKTGKPISFEDAIRFSESFNNKEWVCKRKDGSSVALLMSIIPQFSVENKLIGYIFSGADISATKKVETELEQQIKFLQILIDSMPIAVFYKDSSMTTIGCNKAFEDMTERAKDDLVGKTSEDNMYYDKESVNVFLSMDAMIQNNMASASYERVVEFKDSAPRNIVMYKSSYRNLDGSFGGIVGVMIDVTEERKMQAERDALQANLIQQNKLASLGQLAGSIAHELNNPLSIIIGYAQVLIKDARLDAETRKGILNIFTAADRSKNIITNMLEFARSDTAKTQLVKLGGIIESTILIVEKDLLKAGIEIIKEIQTDERMLAVNPMQIQQALLNIILNAKDAMPDGGTISIKTFERDGKMILTISDTGVGIPKDNLSKIFDPFFTTKSTGRGTGLGLSIC